MTKSDYLSNSAKLLLVSSCLLFLANALVAVADVSETFLAYSEQFSTFCFYAVLVMGFLAFNGEGIAYKRSKEPRGRAKTRILKILLIAAFLIRYVKTPVENLALSVPAESVTGSFLRLFLGAFNTVASYGFLFTVVAFWYIFRDSGVKKLMPFEAFAFILGLVYNVYKTLNYSVAKYGFHSLGADFATAFSNEDVLHILCLLQFAADIVMFAAVLKYYDKQAIVEQEKKSKAVKKMVTARKIYNTDRFGLDTLEDDFFLK